MPRFTASEEDYLKAIYEVHEKSGSDVKSVDLAKRLKFSKPSVSAMIKKLVDNGYLSASAYSKIRLTTKGRRKAIQLIKKHRIIEVFLSDFLGKDKRTVHTEAHRLEHAFSDDSINKLDAILNRPKQSPYGRKIPR